MLTFVIIPVWYKSGKLSYNTHSTNKIQHRMKTPIKPVKIGNKLVGPGHPTYIIGEVGINHNGDLDVAMKLIDLAVDAGADAVKLQTRTVDVVYSAEELAKPRQVPKALLEQAIKRGVLSPEAITRLQESDFEKSTNGDLKRALELTDAELGEIDGYCKAKGIAWLTSCWDTKSLERIERLFPDTPCHKIASACNEDDELLRLARSTGKPIILSTGMSDLAGIKKAVEVLGGTDNLVVLHCTSVYATGLEAGLEVLKQINLLGIDTLLEQFNVPVGFSSHDSGILPSYAAVARGACMVEKHITLERAMWGSDQASSLDPVDWVRLCRAIRELPVALGNGVIEIYPEEVPVAKKLRRVRRQ